MIFLAILILGISICFSAGLIGIFLSNKIDLKNGLFLILAFMDLFMCITAAIYFVNINQMKKLFGDSQDIIVLVGLLFCLFFSILTIIVIFFHIFRCIYNKLQKKRWLQFSKF